MFIRGPTGNKIMKKMNSKISYDIIPSKKEKIYEIQNHFLLFYVHTVTFHCKDSEEYYTSAELLIPYLHVPVTTGTMTQRRLWSN